MNCDNEREHGARVAEIKESMLADEKISDLCARFKVISEPSRLKILLALEGGELCVDHITEAVGGNQSAVSHQLKILKDNTEPQKRSERLIFGFGLARFNYDRSGKGASELQ